MGFAGSAAYNGLQTVQSPDNRPTANQFLQHGAYGSVGVSQQLMSPNDGLGLNIYDLQVGPAGNPAQYVRQSAEQIASNVRSNYRYQRHPSSNSRGTNIVRSKSSNSQQNPFQAVKSGLNNADLERENYPPTLGHAIATKQPKQLLVVPAQPDQASQQQQEVFNPLLTIKPVPLSQTVHSNYNAIGNQAAAVSGNGISSSEAGTQGGDFSRDGISRSFEAKLMSSKQQQNSSGLAKNSDE